MPRAVQTKKVVIEMKLPVSVDSSEILEKAQELALDMWETWTDDDEIVPHEALITNAVSVQDTK